MADSSAKGFRRPSSTGSTSRPSRCLICAVIREMVRSEILSELSYCTRMSMSLSGRYSPRENEPKNLAFLIGCPTRYCRIFGIISCVALLIIAFAFAAANVASCSIIRKSFGGISAGAGALACILDGKPLQNHSFSPRKRDRCKKIHTFALVNPRNKQKPKNNRRRRQSLCNYEDQAKKD